MSIRRKIKICQYKFTERDSVAFQKYLNDIRKFKLITPDEEFNLFEKYHSAGDLKVKEQIKKKIIESNIRFVVSVAKFYYTRKKQEECYMLSDLVAAGNIGLILSIDKFDYHRGFKLITFAVFLIRNEIGNFINCSKSNIYLPIQYNYDFIKIDNEINDLMHQQGIDINFDDYINEHSDYNCYHRSLYKNLNHIRGGTKRLDEHAYNENLIFKDNKCSIDEENLSETNICDNITFLDYLQNDFFPSPDKNFLLEGLKIEINRVLNSLDNDIQKKVIKLYFGLNNDIPISLEEIGVILNLSRERVRQIKEKTLRRLRHISRSKFLVEYLNETID